LRVIIVRNPLAPVVTTIVNYRVGSDECPEGFPGTAHTLVYFVSSAFDVGLTRGVYEVNYACDPPNVSKARAIVVSDLKNMRDKTVTSRELRQARVLLLREIPLSESSVERVAQSWLSRSALDLPLDEPVRAARRYVKLSAADVRAAFAKWLRPEDLVQVTQGPAPK
jgi:zinc protease